MSCRLVLAGPTAQLSIGSCRGSLCSAPRTSSTLAEFCGHPTVRAGLPTEQTRQIDVGIDSREVESETRRCDFDFLKVARLCALQALHHFRSEDHEETGVQLYDHALLLLVVAHV